MSIDPKALEYFSCFCHTFLLALTTPVIFCFNNSCHFFLTVFRWWNILGPKAQLRDLDTTCNLSYFLKGVMKMADIDIDPVGNHDKMDEQPDTY